MRVPNTDSVTQDLMTKIESWRAPEHHWAKKYIATRIVSLAAPIFAAIDVAYHAVNTVGKLPVAVVKGTVGRIPLPSIGKLNERLPDSLGICAVLRHALKTALFAMDFFLAPVVGFISPPLSIAMHAKTGLYERPDATKPIFPHVDEPVVAPATPVLVTPVPIAPAVEAAPVGEKTPATQTPTAPAAPVAEQATATAATPVEGASNASASADEVSGSESDDDFFPAEEGDLFEEEPTSIAEKAPTTWAGAVVGFAYDFVETVFVRPLRIMNVLAQGK